MPIEAHYRLSGNKIGRKNTTMNGIDTLSPISDTSAENYEIEIVTDYDKFKFFDENRDISESHVNEIVREIKKHGWLSSKPVEVNWDTFQVGDGQHRVRAAMKYKKETGVTIPIPVLKIKGLTPEDAAKGNAHQKGWTLTDWIRYHAKRGNKEYGCVMGLWEQYHNVLPREIVNRVVIEECGITENELKDEQLKISDSQHERIIHILNYFSKFSETFITLRKFNHQTIGKENVGWRFYYALLFVAFHSHKYTYKGKRVDLDRLLFSFNKAPHLPKPPAIGTTTSQNVELLDRLYNNCLSGDKKINFVRAFEDSGGKL